MMHLPKASNLLLNREQKEWGYKLSPVNNLKYLIYKITTVGGFPGGVVVKNPPANAGDTGSIPGLGRSHMPWSN